MFWTCLLEDKIETEIDQILNYFLDLLILVMYITVALWGSVKKVFLNISQVLPWNYNTNKNNIKKMSCSLHDSACK